MYYVILIVCLSVCLFSNFVQKLRTDLHEIFREGWQWANLQMIKFWWRSGLLYIIAFLLSNLAKYLSAHRILNGPPVVTRLFHSSDNFKCDV